MYLENTVKAKLGLIGHTNPSLALVQARVTAKGYTGYVAAGYKAPTPVKPKAKPKSKPKSKVVKTDDAMGTTS